MMAYVAVFLAGALTGCVVTGLYAAFIALRFALSSD